MSQTEGQSLREAAGLVMTYHLANRGTADLRFGAVSTSCGCSSATVRPERVPPGGTAQVSVEGRPPSVGTNPVRIRVATNDPDQPSLTLNWDLSGHPTPPKLMTPELAVHLGILRCGQIPLAQVLTFDILEDGGTPPLIRTVVPDNPTFRVEGGFVVEGKANDPNFVMRTYRYVVNFSRAMEVGAVAHRLDVFRDDHAGGPWLTIPIRGAVLPLVRAVPASIRFAGRRDGVEQVARLMVICDDHSAAVEVECGDHDPALTCRVVGRESDRVIFEVVRDGSLGAGIARPLRFRITSPVATTLDVPIQTAIEK